MVSHQHPSTIKFQHEDHWKAIASRLDAIARRLKAIASRLETIASRLETIASRLEGITIRGRPSLLFQRVEDQAT